MRVIRGIDSSLCVTLLFPVFLTRHSYPPALNDEGRQSVIMRETLNVIPSECEGSAGVARESVKCHSERQRRICCYGEESGKKITAISCELSANSAE